MRSQPTFSVSSHDEKRLQLFRQRRVQLYCDSQVSEGGCGYKYHLKVEDRFALRILVALLVIINFLIEMC